MIWSQMICEWSGVTVPQFSHLQSGDGDDNKSAGVRMLLKVTESVASRGAINTQWVLTASGPGMEQAPLCACVLVCVHACVYADTNVGKC